MRLINMTGNHAVSIVAGASYDASIRKYVGGEIALTIEPSGTMLSAKFEEVPGEPLVVNVVSIPTTVKKLVSCDPVPTADEDTYFIVSMLYKNAVAEMGGDTSHLLTTNGCVVADDGKGIKGCLSLCR